MEITASMVKELREKTGAGMMDCKKALSEAEGVMERAIDVLREKGLAKAAKKSSRVAAEGLVRMEISQDGKSGAMVEVNSETDFVAKNEEFQVFVETVAKMVVEHKKEDVAEFKTLTYMGANETVEEVLNQKIAKIGENLTIRRFAYSEVANGAVVSYLHGGKIGVIVSLESDAAVSDLQDLGRDIAMQAAAMNPRYLSKDDVDQEYIAHEREVLVQQALNEGKPANIVEKMVEGRLQKELKEVCLLEQVFVKDSDFTVGQIIKNAATKLGKEIKVTKFVRFEVGEGLEKKEENFAEEVAKQLGN
ncbi:MAG: translation elongation factor Ts [Filifactoraceae bacterium]